MVDRFYLTYRFYICSVDVVRLIWPRSDNLNLWPQIANTGQILAQKGQIFESKSDFHIAASATFCNDIMHFQEIWRFTLYTLGLILFQVVMCLLKIIRSCRFQKNLKNVLKIHPDKELADLIEYQSISKSNFVSKIVYFWSDFDYIFR